MDHMQYIFTDHRYFINYYEYNERAADIPIETSNDNNYVASFLLIGNWKAVCNFFQKNFNVIFRTI